MPNVLKSPLLWVIAIVAFASSVACGGTAEQYGGLSDDEAAQLKDAVGSWTSDFLDARYADLDRDFVFCLGPDDPIPVETPVPDPSGHSRARLLCEQAAMRVKESADGYRALFARLETLEIPENDAAVQLRSDLLDIYRLRLDLFDQIVAALDAGDAAKLADLRQPYSDMTVAESKASEITSTIKGP